MGCPKLTERDYYRLHNCTEKTAYSGFFHTVSDDTIGNRKTYDTTESGSNVQSVYSANNLNQYTNITNPSQSPTYDDDGNMLTMTLGSGSWTNTFNAENRIIAQEKSDQRIEYTYDYAGSRVEKKIYSGSTGNWTLVKHSLFVYDGYEQIEELDALNSNTITKKRIWGYDEFLANIQGSSTYYAIADANHNITEYIDSTGTIQEHTEYSPFGKVTKQNGTLAGQFDYGFSSESKDKQTGLIYYTFRYYSPELGRWLSRDPIEENGGWNLYSFNYNNPLIFSDYLGLGDEEKLLEIISPKPEKSLFETINKMDIIDESGHLTSKGVKEAANKGLDQTVPRTKDELKAIYEESGKTGGILDKTIGKIPNNGGAHNAWTSKELRKKNMKRQSSERKKKEKEKILNIKPDELSKNDDFDKADANGDGDLSKQEQCVYECLRRKRKNRKSAPYWRLGRGIGDAIKAILGGNFL